MKFKIIAAALAAFAIALASIPAAAQSQCRMTRDQAVSVLESRYGEAVIHRGLTRNGVMLEVFVNQDGDSWTVLTTTPSGCSAIRMEGTAWISNAAPVPGDDA